jgi:hypothetical protein
MRGFDHTVRIGDGDAGLIVDKTPVECHGGLAQITWHIGNLEPTIPDTGIHLAVRFDGEVVGGLLRGDPEGIWGDDATDIHAVVECPAGSHVIDLEVQAISGEWGFPYVANVGERQAHGLVVNRGFTVEEVWG